MMRTITHLITMMITAVVLSGCFTSTTSVDELRKVNGGKGCFLLSSALFLVPNIALNDDGTVKDAAACNNVTSFTYKPRIDEVLRHPEMTPTAGNTGVSPVIEICKDNGVGFVVPNPKYTALKSGVSTWIVEKIEAALDTGRKAMYNQLATGSMNTIAQICMVLVLAMYALALIMGMVQANGYAVVMIFLKIIAVYMLVTQGTFFDKYVFDVFEGFVNGFSCLSANVFAGTGDDLCAASASAGGKIPVGLFNMVDQTLTLLFSFEFVTVLFAVSSSGWAGPIYAIMMAGFVITYAFTAVGAVKSYVIAMIARYLLYAMAPIFLVFLLFNQTKSLFDGWMEQLMSFSMQPVFLMTFIGMFHVVIMGFLPALIQYDTKVCYTEMHDMTVMKLYGYVFGDGVTSPKINPQHPEVNIPINFWVIVSMCILAYLMKSMADWSVAIAARLSSGFINVSEANFQGGAAMQEIISGQVQGVAAYAGSIATGHSHEEAWKARGQVVTRSYDRAKENWDK